MKGRFYENGASAYSCSSGSPGIGLFSIPNLSIASMTQALFSAGTLVFSTAVAMVKYLGLMSIDDKVWGLSGKAHQGNGRGLVGGYLR